MHTNNNLNPWFSIWTQPRQTIRQVQRSYSVKKIIWLWVIVFVLTIAASMVLQILILDLPLTTAAGILLGLIV
ncbi:MAG: hypothetical protein B7X06_01500, partial [Verrucomicrobia bacterium 21-51-4]